MSLNDLLTVVNTTISIPLDVMILFEDFKTYGSQSMIVKNADCYKSLIRNKPIIDMIVSDDDMFSTVLQKGEEYGCLGRLLNLRYNTEAFNGLNTWLDVISDSSAISILLGATDLTILLNAGMKDTVYGNCEVGTASVSYTLAKLSGSNNVSGYSFGDPITGLLTKASIVHSEPSIDSDMFTTGVGLNVASISSYGGSGNKTISYIDNPIVLNNIEVRTTGSETNSCYAAITTTVTIEYYKLPKEVTS